MPLDYLVRLHDAKKSANLGTKAANLRFLARKGFRVPTTFVCTWDAYVQYL
jgi:phosphoenolpyruvate synthase/pyruvate phosphate dikinase